MKPKITTSGSNVRNNPYEPIGSDPPTHPNPYGVRIEKSVRIIGPSLIIRVLAQDGPEVPMLIDRTCGPALCRRTNMISAPNMVTHENKNLCPD